MIDKMNLHYSFTNPASVHDEEALTALELAGRQGAKINEVIDDQNRLRSETEDHLNDQDDEINRRLNIQDTAIENIRTETVPIEVDAEIQRQIDNGTFDLKIEDTLGNLIQRVDNLVENTSDGSTTLDAEVIDGRVRNSGATYDSLGDATRAIDSDLHSFMQETSGNEILLDSPLLAKNWVSGIPTVNTDRFSVDNGVLKLTLTPSQALSTNNGIAVPLFEANDEKIRIDFSFSCTAPSARLNVSVSSKYGVTSGQNTVIATIAPGAHSFVINPSQFNHAVNTVWFTHNNSVTTEVSHVYSFTKFIATRNPLKDRGLTGNNVVDFLNEHENRLDALEHGITSETNILNMDSTQLWSGNTNNTTFQDDTVVIADPGDKGVMLSLENVDFSRLVRLDFDISTVRSSDSYFFNVYVANTNALADGNHELLSLRGSNNLYVGDGHYSVVFDPSYYSVYRFEPNWIWLLHHTGSGNTATTTISNIRLYQSPFLDAGLPDNTVDAILSLTGNQSEQTEVEKYLVAPDGNKYVMQVNSSGIPSAIPVAPSTALFLGNSLLLGFGEFGMAASAVNKDYYYLFNEAVKDFNANYTADRVQASTWEGYTTVANQNSYLNNTVLPLLNDELDLVVIQLGDNVNTTEKQAVFEEGCRNFLQFVRTHAPNARVVWMGAWYQSSNKMNQMISGCQKTGSTFVNIWDLAVDENRSAVGNTYETSNGTQTITSEGVASHPGDNGMKAIANRLLYTLGITDTENYYE